MGDGQLVGSPHGDVEVLPISTPVHMGNGDIPGVVSAICLRGSGVPRVTYEVTFWDGRTRNQEWVDPSEIAVAEGRPGMTIGFRQTLASANGKRGPW